MFSVHSFRDNGMPEALHDLRPHTRETRALADDVFRRDEWITRAAAELGVEVVL